MIYKVNLEPKKSKGRTAFVSYNTFDLVEQLMRNKEAKMTDIMFDLGKKKSNPYEMWTKRVNRFLKTMNIGKITTHDFRKTAATNLYNQTNSIVKVQ